MKIKATFKSSTGRRSVMIEGTEFVNEISRTVDISKSAIALIHSAAEDGWFTIEQEWDENNNLITGENAPVVPVEPTPVETEPGNEPDVIASEEPEATEPEATEVNLADMTKAELLAYAEANGFEVTSSMTKAEIIAVIEG